MRGMLLESTPNGYLKCSREMPELNYARGKMSLRFLVTWVFPGNNSDWDWHKSFTSQVLYKVRFHIMFWVELQHKCLQYQMPPLCGRVKSRKAQKWHTISFFTLLMCLSHTETHTAIHVSIQGGIRGVIFRRYCWFHFQAVEFFSEKFKLKNSDFYWKYYFSSYILNNSVDRSYYKPHRNVFPLDVIVLEQNQSNIRTIF